MVPKVYIGYATADRHLGEALAKHLRPLKLAGELETWHASEVPAGEDWQAEALRQLEIAELIVFLVSPDFFDSRRCWERELPRALKRHEAGEARVIPVIARACQWQPTPLGNLKPLPLDGRVITAWEQKDDAWFEVVNGIRAELNSAARLEDESPGSSDESTVSVSSGPEQAREEIPNDTAIPIEAVVEKPWELRFTVSREATSYSARWIIPNEQESEPFELKLPINERDASRLRWYFEDYLNFPGIGDRRKANEIEKQLTSWGEAVFEALFAGREGGRLEGRIDQACAEGRRVTLTLGSDEPEFHAQPWEMLRDRRGPLVFRGITVRRQLLGPRSLEHLRFASPLRVLLIVSRPDEAGFVDPRNSKQPMFEALEKWPEGMVDVEFCEPPTFERLEEMISEARRVKRPFHIVHFDGHGKYLPETGVAALAFEADENGSATRLVNGRELGDLLSRVSVPLVLLEACRSSALSKRPIHNSVAPALLEAGVGSVVAFSHSIHVVAARILVERFYRELTNGTTLSQALEEARIALFANRRRWVDPSPGGDTVELQDWSIVQLYQVGEDPVVIAPERKSLKATGVRIRHRWEKRLLGDFPPEPLYKFHGRAADLLRIERLFRRSTSVLLAGMGGMGKTALSREAAVWWLRTARFELAIFHSFEMKAGTLDIVQSIGRAIIGNNFSSRSSDEQREEAIRLFQRRRILLVWDNFESTLEVFQKGDLHQFDKKERADLLRLYHRLTEGNPTGRILVTCRPNTAPLPNIETMNLKGLWRTDSFLLLASILKKRRIPLTEKDWGRDATEELLQDLADHPLSISLIAPHLGELDPLQIRHRLRSGLRKFSNTTSTEARNRSLLASLEFSKKRLSNAAQALLPYLGWFKRGVTEDFFLKFTRTDANSWGRSRLELEATALLRVEDISWNNSSYLHFHPTLRYAAPREAVADVDATKSGFIELYLHVEQFVRTALNGAQPSTGMACMQLEEANFRTALEEAMKSSDRRTWRLAETLGTYLERAGRRHERDFLASWAQEYLSDKSNLDEASCNTVRRQAQSLVSKGQTDLAIKSLEELIIRLERERGDLFQVATTYSYLGDIYNFARSAESALSAAERAIEILETQQDDRSQAKLAVTLGVQANALIALGRFDQALTVSERGVSLSYALDDQRNVAAGLARSAEAYRAQHLWKESDTLYKKASAAARAAGDMALQGLLTQHRAFLHQEQGDPRRALTFGKEALLLFQAARNSEGEMHTCILLGNAERDQGNFSASEAWYMRAREFAAERGDNHILAVAARNIGILHIERVEHKTHDDEFLRLALASFEESLTLAQNVGNQIEIAATLFQLGHLHHRMGNLGQAKRFIVQSLEIREPLNHPETHRNYEILTLITREQGDTAAASEWKVKYDMRISVRNSGRPDSIR